MEESKLSNSESLQIITEMIGRAKRNMAKKGSFYFLLWGWVVLIGNFGFYIIARYQLFPYPYVIWSITLPAIIVTVIYSMRQNRKSIATSQLDNIYMNLWMAIFVAVVIVLVFMPKMNYSHNAVILLLAGLGTFVTGKLIKFNPLVIGSLALWIGAIIAFNVPVIDQYLVGGFAIIVGYLIPGYLLKRAEGE
jgi:hypothetical protein